jgi:hypothetical protein
MVLQLFMTGVELSELFSARRKEFYEHMFISKGVCKDKFRELFQPFGAHSFVFQSPNQKS